MTATLELIVTGTAGGTVAGTGAGASVAASSDPANVTGPALDLLRSAQAAVLAGPGRTADHAGSDPAVAALVRLALQLVGGPTVTGRIAADHGLSEREHEVLELVARGFSVAQIARHLTVTGSTVTFHLGRIYAKTGVRTRHELTELVWSAGRVA